MTIVCQKSDSLSPLHVRLVAGEDQDAWLDVWRQLVPKCIMQFPEWRMNAWHEYHRGSRGISDRELTFAAIQSAGGECLGISTWFRQRQWGVLWWKLPGSGPICSDYTRIPCRPGTERLVGESVADWFISRGRESWVPAEPIEIDGHRDDSPEWNAFFERLTQAGWHRDTVAIEGGWRIELPGTWDAYVASLHYSQRRKAKKAIKRIDSGKLQHLVIRDLDGIRRWWPEFVRLHQKRRQHVGEPGCFTDPAFERFLKRTVCDLARSELAWFSIVVDAGTPLAILLILDSEDFLWMYQSGIDTDRLPLEPGHVANAATIRMAIQQGKKWFDFLRGDERYKAGWLAQRIPLYRTRLFPPGFAGWGMTAAMWLGRQWRRRCDHRPNSSGPLAEAAANGEGDDES